MLREYWRGCASSDEAGDARLQHPDGGMRLFHKRIVRIPVELQKFSEMMYGFEWTIAPDKASSQAPMSLGRFRIDGKRGLIILRRLIAEARQFQNATQVV